MAPVLRRLSPVALRVLVAVVVVVLVGAGAKGGDLVRDPVAGREPPAGAGSPGDMPPPATRAAPKPSDCAVMPVVPRPRRSAPATGDQPTYFGVLGSRISDPAAMRAAGVTSVTLAVGWDQLEPRRGCMSRSYVARIRQQYADYRAAGLDVVLDAGLQYPPACVFSLPGDTRFVNQYGEMWRGPVGADVPDAVFNPAVRMAQGLYLAALGSVFRDVTFDAVRIGGLVNNELHYPVRSFGGHSDSLWAFSAQARASSPVPDYRPGSGSAADAQRFLDHYLGAINDYATWQATRYRYAFGRGPTLQVLLPSWGVRPGDRAAAEQGLLGGRTRGELTGALNEGLDWDTLAARVDTWPGRTEMYTTWLDAADQSTTDPRYVSPVRYLARIAQPLGLTVSGENTGGNDAEAMRRSVERVSSLGLAGMFWFNADELLGGRHATLGDYSGLIAASSG